MGAKPKHQETFKNMQKKHAKKHTKKTCKNKELLKELTLQTSKYIILIVPYVRT